MVFSGIVEEMGTVVSMKKVNEITLWDGSKGEGYLLKIKAKIVLNGCSDGCSIAVNGVCLTALPGWNNNSVTFGVSPETLRCTNLGELKEGSKVNLERSLRADSRNSGHYVQGHVDCVGRIKKFKQEGDSLWVTIEIPKTIINYIVRKGYISVDGTSLTVCNVDEKNLCFDLMLVAHTQQCVSRFFSYIKVTQGCVKIQISNTEFSFYGYYFSCKWLQIIMPHYALGAKVNLEVDVMGKYASKYSAALKDKVNNLESKMNAIVTFLTVLTIGIVGYKVYK